MSQPGIGMILNYLGGNEETVKAYKSAIGKTIKEVSLVNNHLQILFEKPSVYGIEIWDEGQSCCESRYMVCDDNLPEFSKAKLLDIELADGGERESEDGESHEIQFLRIKTSKGTIVCSNHNEHNGWYGGFGINIRKI